MATMKVEIVTPEGAAYDNQAEMLTIRTIDGDRGVLPNHEPFVSGVDIGKVKIKEADEEHFLAVSHGYMEITEEKATVLVETAEFAEEIDVDRAVEAKKRAEEKLEQIERREVDHINEERAEIALRKALNRLKVAKGSYGEFELEETE
jgi:F-type H+-transporting ATPase subunit epsilon